MIITLMRYKSENNCIGKELVTIDIVQGVLKTSTSALDIMIELRLKDIDKVTRTNYVYIDKLKKYYFVTDKVLDTGGLYVLTCHVDVLETYSDKIRDLYVIVDKMQDASRSDLYIDDGSFVTENRYINHVYNFPNGFNNTGEFILITVGG